MVRYRPAMRRLCLTGSFLALLAAACALWTFRFERVPGMPVWRLADLRAIAPMIPGLEWIGPQENPVLRVRVDAANSQVAARLVIPRIPVVKMLHIRFRMASSGLIAGKEYWQDGRFMIEWHSPDGMPGWESDPVCSLRLDGRSGEQAFVVNPDKSPAVPALRLEHLGTAGEFELADLEITVVDESAVWKNGRWFLVAGWIAWAAACVGSWPGIRWTRSLAAASIWVLMGILFVIPGPWKIQRPIYQPFRIGAEAPSVVPPDPAHKLDLRSGPAPALGRIPEQGSFALRVKLRLTQARPLLHLLLLFAPALVIACIAGRKPALFLVTGLALAIEGAEFAFGFGIGWDDALDLASDFLGIALALWAHLRLRVYLESKSLGKWIA